MGATTDDGSTITIDDSEVNTSISGDYNVYYNASDLSGNIAVQVVRIVTVEASTLSNENFTKEIEISVYPNPVVDILMINSNFETAYLYNLNGERVAIATQRTMDVIDLENGVYILKVKTENGLGIVKIIKK